MRNFTFLIFVVMTFIFVAGAVGAIGALGIVLAFKFGGKPFYVMPLVFGLAPIINTLVTMLMGRTFKQASVPFYLGIVIVAIGAAGVLYNKPKPVKTVGDEIAAVADEIVVEAGVSLPTTRADGTNSLWIGLSIALTALCWGAYGPVLHKGQAKMQGSRLRPFLCVGLAYFVIAVVAPLFMLGVLEDPGSFDNLSGIAWSFAAGATGAIGALGIIYAFNFGGKPLYVMPLVFGFAPVVNTFYEIATKNLYGHVPQLFFVSLAMVITRAGGCHKLILILLP